MPYVFLVVQNSVIYDIQQALNAHVVVFPVNQERENLFNLAQNTDFCLHRKIIHDTLP